MSSSSATKNGRQGGFSWGMFALAWTALMIGSFHRCCAQATDTTEVKEPTKGAVIDLLQTVYGLLDIKDYVSASAYFVLPPEFEPKMLGSLIEKSEISAAGIGRLEKEAKFGAASGLFGAERAAHFANRASVDIAKCYGFNFETEEATAEVICVWDGSKLKLIRLDDVGKLIRVEKTMAAPEKRPQIDKDKLLKALPLFKAAASEHPDDIAALASYAMALYKVGNLQAAWSKLVEARKLQPDHGGVARGMEAILNAFENKGLFVVGAPTEIVEEWLGSPDEKVQLTGRQRWVYAFLGVDFKAGRLHEIVDLRGATESLFQPTETLAVALDGRGWTCRVRKKSRGTSGAFYYLPEEGLTNWTERVEIERILGGVSVGSIEEIGRLAAKQMSDRYPGVTFRVLKTDGESAIISFVIPADTNSEKRHQLVRLFKGPVDGHRLAYTIKTDLPSPELQAEWLAILEAATLPDVNQNEKPENEAGRGP